MISINTSAPNIKLTTDDGFFDSKNFIGKKLVVFFYPRANTSGCTLEAISFSELKNEFDDLNTVIIGISKDDQKKQRKFREKNNLTCYLGSDDQTNVCEKFGVWVEKSMYGKKYMGIERTTFLIDEEGKIVFIWNKVKVKNHAQEVLDKINELISL